MNEDSKRGIALLGDLSAALARLTWIPVPSLDPVLTGGGAPGRIVWAYPVIGALMGAVGGAVYTLAFTFGLPALLAAVLALGAMVALTAARPENCLVRCAEYLAGRQTGADGGLGTVGIIALVMTLAARVGAIAALSNPMVVATALIAAGALSQAAVVASMHFVPPADDDDDDDFDDDDEDAATPASTHIMAAALIAIVIAALVLPFGAGGAMVAACAGGAAVAAVAVRRGEGYTPDLLGAAQQISELAVLVVLAGIGGTTG